MMVDCAVLHCTAFRGLDAASHSGFDCLQDEAARALLAAGADEKLVNGSGESASALVVEHWHEHVRNKSPRATDLRGLVRAAAENQVLTV